MLWKIVIVFLCAMVLVGMLGKLLFPGAMAKRSGKCPACGRPRIGRRCGCKGGRA